MVDGGVAHGKRSFHTVRGLANHASSQQRQISVDMSPKRTLASGFDSREASLDAGSTSSSGSFHSARQSTIGASSPEQPTLVAETPSHPIGNDSYLQELRELPKLPLTRRQTVQKNIPGDAAGRALPTSPSVASQGTKRIVPDRSAEPSGDPDVVRRRRKPEDSSIVTELSVSTSLGESAPDTQGTKRPLPRSPTTAAQPTDTARRHHQARERSGREGMGRASQLEKKDSKNQRGRA